MVSPFPAHRDGSSLRACLALLGSVWLAACVPRIGPGTIPVARFDYNERIIRSWNEQMLLNLVRLRYRDTPYFLEVTSVLTQYSATRRGLLRGEVQLDGDGLPLGGEMGAEVSERPTITFQPLQGEAFATRLLAPLPLGTLSLLAGSGWSVERLLLCCVDGIGPWQNAPTAAGPTPVRLTPDTGFVALARDLRELQVAGAIDIEPPATGGDALELRVSVDRAPAEAWRRIRTTLRLGDSTQLVPLRPVLVASPSDVGVRRRSLLGTMYYLSQTVDAPEMDVSAGRVTVTRRPDGTPLDWRDVQHGIFHVRTGRTRPAAAFVAVRYRDHWFWIEDDDLESKTTFALLANLFSLQAAGLRTMAPLVTVPSGG